MLERERGKERERPPLNPPVSLQAQSSSQVGVLYARTHCIQSPRVRPRSAGPALPREAVTITKPMVDAMRQGLGPRRRLGRIAAALPARCVLTPSPVDA